LGRFFWNGFGIDQGIFTVALIGPLSSVQAGPANAKVAACIRHMAYPFCMLQHPKLALDLALVVLRHRKHLLPSLE
jgi:hypothetical protein